MLIWKGTAYRQEEAAAGLCGLQHAHCEFRLGFTILWLQDHWLNQLTSLVSISLSV